MAPSTKRMAKSLRLITDLAYHTQEGVAREALTAITNISNIAKVGLQGIVDVAEGPGKNVRGKRGRRAEAAGDGLAGPQLAQ